MNKSDIASYFPVVYKGVLETDLLAKAEDFLFDELAGILGVTTNNEFIQTADIRGIERYEEILGIKADPTTEDLEFRRQRVLTRISTAPPFTLRYLKDKLDEIVGPDRWSVEVDYNNYTLYINTSVVNQGWYHELYVMVNQIKPANIVFVNRPGILSDLLLSEQIAVQGPIGNYRLGTTWRLGREPYVTYLSSVYLYVLGEWELGMYPFIVEGEPEVFKLASEPSLTPQLMNDTALFVADDIVSVRLNDTVNITTFNSKTVSDNVVEVWYDVTVAMGITEVTNIKLLGEADKVLSDAVVYIPVRADSIFQHKITVKEGV